GEPGDRRERRLGHLGRERRAVPARVVGGLGRADHLRSVGRPVAVRALEGVPVLRLPLRRPRLPRDRCRVDPDPARIRPAAAVAGRRLHRGGHRVGGEDAAHMSGVATVDLAVVIVNFNTGDWLARCLSSLDRHRGDLALDVVVVDNASNDGSYARATDERPWVRLIRNPTNRFLSPAWNQGAAATSASYLLFLNPDTEWWRGTLADYVAVANAHPRAGIVGPMIRGVDGGLYPSGRAFPSVVNAVGHGFVSPFTRDKPFTHRSA